MSQLKIKDGNNWVNIPAGGIGVPSGGNTGDVLVKSSSTDYATEWNILVPKIDYSNVIYPLTQDQKDSWAYTVPTTGVLYLNFEVIARSWLPISVNGNNICSIAFQPASGDGAYVVTLMVSKGDIVTIPLNANTFLYSWTCLVPITLVPYQP